MVLTINPYKLKDSQEYNLLRTLLFSATSGKVWSKNSLYRVNNHSVQLTVTVVAAANPNHFYLIGSTILGASLKSKIFPIRAVLQYSNDTLQVNYINDKVVKLTEYKHSTWRRVEDSKLMHQHEFTQSKLIKHLGVEVSHFLVNKNTQNKKSEYKVESYLVLNKFAGVSLSKWLNPAFAGTREILSQYRMAKLLKLYNAYESQVMVYGLVHNDVKPHNIIFNDGMKMQTSDVTIPLRELPANSTLHFVDYASSAKYGEKRFMRGGTPYFQAREISAEQPVQEGNEVYYKPFENEISEMVSLGITAQLFFGLPYGAKLPAVPQERNKALANIHQKCFAKEENVFSLQFLSRIYEAFDQMIVADPTIRWNFKQSLTAFQAFSTELDQNYYAEKSLVLSQQFCSQATMNSSTPFTVADNIAEDEEGSNVFSPQSQRDNNLGLEIELNEIDEDGHLSGTSSAESGKNMIQVSQAQSAFFAITKNKGSNGTLYLSTKQGDTPIQVSQIDSTKHGSTFIQVPQIDYNITQTNASVEREESETDQPAIVGAAFCCVIS